MKLMFVFSALLGFWVGCSASGSHSYNHADNIPKMFAAAYSKFRGGDELKVRKIIIKAYFSKLTIF